MRSPATRTASTAPRARCARSSTGCTGRASCSPASSPPDEARAAHAELADALVDARDATGEVAEALELGGADAAADLLFEWRGALFRVRLARLRLGARPEPAPAPPEEPPYSAGAASLLALFGAVAFVTGAALVLWPMWAAGIALVAGGLLVHRP